MTCRKHDPRPLFIRPANEVGRVDYLLAQLADWVRCANCDAIGQKNGTADMNKTETVAYGWLRRHYAAADISFHARRSPDFRTADGKGWEVKLARNRALLFSVRQMATLQTERDLTVLVFDRDGDTEPQLMPASALDGKRWGAYRIDVFDRAYVRQDIYAPPQVLQALREEHARTYPEHRLSFSAWLLARIMR